MDAEKHVKEKQRLEQSLGDKFTNVQNGIKEVLVKSNIDVTPELALDICRYTIEEMCLEKIRVDNIGKYEKAGNEAMEEGNLNFTNNYELARISLKVLDTISQNSDRLPVKYAFDILDDAKDIIMQLHSV